MLYTATKISSSSGWFEVEKEKHVFHTKLYSSQSQMIVMDLVWEQK